MDRVERPLSPHLQIYRWQITMWLSSLHRITGLFLSLGAFVFCWWLISLASGPAAYETTREILAGAWFKVPLIGWTFCFFFHLLNGVRHLVWDVGAGFEPSQFRASGWTVVGLTLVATATFSWLAIV
jgi:succinate dehydrogenase / fumarate reductase cytochrome b subunit